MIQWKTFQPGKYDSWELPFVQQRQKMAAGEMGDMPIMGPPGMEDMSFFGPPEAKPYSVEEIRAYNHRWDPYNPLFNDVEYAKKAGYQGLPALPGFVGRGGGAMLGFPKDIADAFYYTNDGTDIELARPIVSGDLLKDAGETNEMVDLTEPGSDLRMWYLGGTGSMEDAAGNIVVKATGNTRDCYKKRADGGPPVDFSENMGEWSAYFPPAHYTTDEDWDRIVSIWDKETIRGADTLYWEDAEIGVFMPETCSGPITYMDMIAWYGNQNTLSRKFLRDKEKRKTCFRDGNGNYLFETALHLGSRNIPGGRMAFYNDTAGHHVLRTVTNYIGDRGYVTRYCWRFYPFFKELRSGFVPKDYDLLTRVVPGYENRPLNRHGGEGDTVIGKAYIYGKRVDEHGRHVIDICAWGEDLEGNILQICPVTACLPTKS